MPIHFLTPLWLSGQKHQSVLIRKLATAISTGNTIKSSIPKIASLFQAFSFMSPTDFFFYYSVGGDKPTTKGYVEGMELSFWSMHVAVSVVGFVQIANRSHLLVVCMAHFR